MLGLILFSFFLIPLSLFINIYSLIYMFFFIFLYFFFGFNFSNFYSFISLSFGLDKYSFCLIVLSIWICILMSYSSLNLQNLYFSYLSLLIVLIFFFLLYCFLSISFFNFYFYFECSILPVFLIIYGWGYQPERLYSSLYFIFYTLISSLPLFLLILYLENLVGYFYFGIVLNIKNLYIFFFFILSFLVKLPMFFFHLWLPSAHVEAPTMGSMILAGVMLKLGGYGLIRVLIFFVDLVNKYSYIFFSVSLFGSLFISLICLLQNDLKVLVAYSSVSHMGLVICGIFSLTSFGFCGSLFLMISHGLVSSGLFYFVGCLYDRYSTRSIFLISGILSISSSLTMFFFFLCLSNMSCPPSLNLISELFISFSLLNWDLYCLFYLFFIMFFVACFMINMFSFVCHGKLSSLVMFMDSGYVREFFIFFLHLFPLYLFVLNLSILF
uniref:NADH-ubiquinone oxidoreductase chain 4 n=1 Tax=Saccharosydne procerus TaxID=871471 RepID=A0A455JWS2_9HEMI|nr:NADH dehydrogenase subunit 4 [Saccharosydne procerus]AVV32032.1 NADH dehydrogenase subunit 4 [Saccharosydne procerus]